VSTVLLFIVIAIVLQAAFWLSVVALVIGLLLWSVLPLTIGWLCASAYRLLCG